MEGYNRIHTLFSDGNIDIDFNDEEQGWDTDVDYVMKADGLYTLDGKPAKELNENYKHQRIRIDNNGMEINDGTERVKIDKNGINITSGEPDNEDKKERIIDSIETRQQREKDSLEEKHEREKEKILNSVPNAILIPVSFPGLIQ
jgi:molecular chaperone DnaK (HSP70)